MTLVLMLEVEVTLLLMLEGDVLYGSMVVGSIMKQGTLKLVILVSLVVV